VLVDLGCRAFLPASQVDLVHVADLNHLVGTTISARIIRLEQERFSVVISRRALLEEERRQRAEALRRCLAAGQVRQGSVKAVCRNSLVVDLGGIETSIRRTEIPVAAGASLVEHFAIGQVVSLTICDVGDDHVTASLRTAPEAEVNTTAASFLADVEAKGHDGGLAIVDAALVLDLSHCDNSEADELLQRAVDQAAARAVDELHVLAAGSLKRRIRSELASGSLSNVDARRSRQTSSGFVLTLCGKGGSSPR